MDSECSTKLDKIDSKRKCVSKKRVSKFFKPSIKQTKMLEDGNTREEVLQNSSVNNLKHECCDEIESCNSKLMHLYYEKPCIELAKDLLGKVLVRRLPSGEILKGKITETECYLGITDKSCHSYGGKVTQRNSAMFMKPGTAYVYSIYGMYYCFNISSQEEGSAVLIRSLEPIVGHSLMHKFRTVHKGTPASHTLKTKDLCNGPSKLCLALNITKELFNKVDLALSSSMWLENEVSLPNCEIIVSTRIGIKSAGEEWANKPMRFYIRDNNFVSIRDKVAELKAKDSMK